MECSIISAQVFYLLHLRNNITTLCSLKSGPASCRTSHHQSFGSKHNSSDLISFGNACLEALKGSSSDKFVLDGLVRIDIMMSNDGNLVLNEFEGIEAVYFSADEVQERTVDCFLEKYWEEKIYDCITNLFSS